MNNKKSIYFLGIGGIGMSALARYFISKGYKVAGYDRTRTHITDALESEGAEISYDENIESIPAYCLNPEETLIVYTPAIPSNHKGFEYFKENNFEVVKRAKILGMITRNSKGLCIAGTHGKTTTSSMLAHILASSKVECNAFLGGILKNYNSNLILSDKSEFTVIEADEYDRSFHQLSPYMAVVTASDPDHLDIYGTEEAYLESFATFTELIDPSGVLLIKKGISLVPRIKEGVRLLTFGREEGDYHAQNIRIGGGEIVFDFVTPDKVIKDIKLGVPVKINIDNAIAAMAIASLNGVEDDEICEAIASYQGPERRFDFWLKREDKVLLDDYAHHPDEVSASISSVKELYPDKHLTVIFYPHLYSRTRDFAPQFAEALSLADRVILLPIYPAREEPIEGVSSEIILNKLTCKEKEITLKENLIEKIKVGKFEVLMTMGAGNIDIYLPEIKEIIEKQ
ncbi:MAG: UDP-N-acetylmuramate--L-alanine ligase [Bacteroidales bacterium]|nr:UDP-N-acetylmuramate--L-alanine ligase [Bacteroidales bacterium]MBR5532031.1 UDP-N-acetylmuramate--L-alanine ligase [Bacteroidales bacterium]